MNKIKHSFIDFDGVILDSEKRVVERKAAKPNISWDEFFEELNWTELLRESKEINNSLSILRELCVLKKRHSILTKIHTLSEGYNKINYLRSKNIQTPVILVPPHVKKNEIYYPNGDILIDDTEKNIKHWNEAGGIGILFDESIICNTEYKVKDLSLLLK